MMSNGMRGTTRVMDRVGQQSTTASRAKTSKNEVIFDDR